MNNTELNQKFDMHEDEVKNKNYEAEKKVTINEYGKEHDWIKVSLILSAVLMFIVACGFNSLASLGYSAKAGLYPKSTSAISDQYYTDITPAGWVFSIWGFIYAWQAILLVYSVTCIFRRSNSGYLLYLKPDFLHYGIFICYIINMMANTIWIFLWGYEQIGWSLLFLIIITFSLYIGLFISHRKMYQNEKLLHEHKLVKEIWMTRAFIQNGMAFYATWVSLASNLNYVTYIVWQLTADITNAGTSALFLILGAVVTYFMLENFFWRHYLQYTFSPWIVLIVALIGSLTKNWITSSPSRNNIITLILLLIVLMLATARIVLFILYKTVLKHRFAGKKIDSLDHK